MGLFDSPTHILIVLVVLVLLFGSAKLPKLAKSLGESMRIFKNEAQKLQGDDKAAQNQVQQPFAQQQLPPAQQAPVNQQYQNPAQPAPANPQYQNPVQQAPVNPQYQPPAQQPPVNPQYQAPAQQPPVDQFQNPAQATAPMPEPPPTNQPG